MAEFTDILTEKNIEMIGKQPVFFVATAAADGRVNLSPKGYDAFRVLLPSAVDYLDLGGSVQRLEKIKKRTCNIDGLPVRPQTSMPYNEQH